jgi:O-antigen ligase
MAMGFLVMLAAALTARAGTVDETTAVLGALVMLAGIAGAVLVVAVEPAVTISFGLALTIFAGQFGHFGIPVGLDRVVLVAGILVTLGRELSRGMPALRTTPVHLLLLAIGVYAVLSALLRGVLTETAPFFSLLDYLGLIPFALFWVAPAAFPSARERRILLGTLVGVGAYLGVTAIIETTGPTSLVLPAYIVDPTVGIHFGRARGPFVEAAANGLSMFFCCVAAAIALVQWRSKGFPVFVLGACAAGIVFTLTRQVWLAAALGTLVAMLSRPELRRWTIPLAATAAVAVVGLLSAVPGLNEEAGARLDEKRPVWERLSTDDAALRMIAERPVLGWGWDAFTDRADPFFRLASDRPLIQGRLHNVFLNYAVQLGIVGLLAWLIALGTAVVSGLRLRGPPDLNHWRTGLIGVVVAWMVVGNFTPMGYSFDHAVLWLWAGLTWSRT